MNQSTNLNKILQSVKEKSGFYTPNDLISDYPFKIGVGEFIELLNKLVDDGYMEFSDFNEEHPEHILSDELDRYSYRINANGKLWIENGGYKNLKAQKRKSWFWNNLLPMIAILITIVLGYYSHKSSKERDKLNIRIEKIENSLINLNNEVYENKKTSEKFDEEFKNFIKSDSTKNKTN